MNAPDRNFASQTPVRRSASAAWIDALAATATIEQQPERLLPHVIEALAAQFPHAPALLSDGESFSFAELAARARAYTRWAMVVGLKPGDRVALMMSNRPEYVAIWLGLSRAGVVTALMNTSLVGGSLAHCLALADPSHVIAESRFAEVCALQTASLPKARLWCHGKPAPGIPSILEAVESELLHQHDTLPDVRIDSPALLIYTSGTTGLPKAAYVSHRRILNWAFWFKGMLGNTPADRMYDCLPLYHSVGGIVAVAATLVGGGSVVIAPKFSASQFWDDIRRWDCTQFQYIGELCRYLLNAPSGDRDRVNRLRVICGNGLRKDVWKPFQERFAIPQVLEFYAATEGNFSLFNAEGMPGAIGRIPPYLRHRFPTAIVRFDVNAATPERNGDGLCIPVEVGEIGEALGRIGEGGGSGRFEGYTDRAESERKIVRDVLQKGDAWFRTGDLMRCDASGFFYFVDRIGDTFRWKGENVSTLEVANALARAPGVYDAVVYGVDVPGMDGKAGMALITVARDCDLTELRRHAESHLAPYAIPLFLRIGKDVALTETFKHRKQDLVRDGFSPSAGGDPVYMWNSASGAYEKIDQTTIASIQNGSLKL